MDSPSKREPETPETFPSTDTAQIRDAVHDHEVGSHPIPRHRLPTLSARLLTHFAIQQDTSQAGYQDFEIVLRRPFHAAFSDFVDRVDNASEAEPYDTHTRLLALRDCHRLLVPDFEKALAKIPGTVIVEVVQRCRTLAAFEGIEWAVPEFLQARMEAALPTGWRAKVTAEDNAMFAEGGIMYGTEIQTKLNDDGKLVRRPCIPASLRHLVVRPIPIGNEVIEVRHI